jgi:hypothetical protein
MTKNTASDLIIVMKTVLNYFRRHNTLLNDRQHNVIRYNVTQQNDNQKTLLEE